MEAVSRGNGGRRLGEALVDSRGQARHLTSKHGGTRAGGYRGRNRDPITDITKGGQRGPGARVEDSMVDSTDEEVLAAVKRCLDGSRRAQMG